jgi:hypothetical protein
MFIQGLFSKRLLACHDVKWDKVNPRLAREIYMLHVPRLAREIYMLHVLNQYHKAEYCIKVDIIIARHSTA